ncbi:MAG: hypothetical protein ACK559_24970, partial [bacterium]
IIFVKVNDSSEEIFVQCLGGGLRCYDLISVLQNAQPKIKWETKLDEYGEARQISFSRQV